MSISLSPSRYCPTVLPLSITRPAWAMDWLVTPRARALSWSTSSRMVLTDSFQLSFTPRVLGLSRSAATTSSACARRRAGSGPITRNCTG